MSTAGERTHRSEPSAEAAIEALRDAGLVLATEDVRIERREERWAVGLPAGRTAWFPASGCSTAARGVTQAPLSWRQVSLM
jgi:hypothetical protein